jgi:hypothetical protein
MQEPVPLQSVVPEGQVAWQLPFVHAALPPAGFSHGVQDEPHDSGLSFPTQRSPQRWKPLLQVNVHSIPSHAVLPLGEVGQTVHADPQAVVLVVSTQRPLQGFFPIGQVPPQGSSTPMHWPRAAQTFFPSGQATPHLTPSQVELPPVAVGQGSQAMPQLFGNLLSTQVPPQV